MTDMGLSVEKLRGGKLLRVEYNNSVKITGDFFLHPEEKITEIEQFLTEQCNEDAQHLIAALQAFVQQQHIELVGITPEAIITNLKKAMR